MKRLLGIVLLLGLASAASAPKVDGIVADGEYAQFLQTDTGMRLYWSVVDGVFYAALSAPSTGWLGLGFESIEGPGAGDPGHAHPAMLESDLWMLAVVDGKVVVEDGYVPEPGKPAADTALGGTSDFLSAAGREVGGVTYVEWSRKLTTGDRFDVDLAKGLGHEIGIMLAYNPMSDDFTVYHGMKSRDELEIELNEGGMR